MTALQLRTAGRRARSRWLPARRGDLDELRAQADADDWDAAQQLARLLARRGDLAGAAQILRARAMVGDAHAARGLARRLADPPGFRRIASA